jgi:hypothetical protein
VQPLDPSTSPTFYAVRQRSSFCLRLKFYVWQESCQLLSLPPLLAIPYASLPTAPSAPAPFCDVKLLTRFGSVGLFSRILLYRLKTRFQKSLGLTSLTVTAFPYAPREAPEAHSLDSAWLPPRYFDSTSLYKSGMTRGSGRGLWNTGPDVAKLSLSRSGCFFWFIHDFQ